MDIVSGPLLRLIFMIIDLYIWVVVIGVVLSWLSALNIVNMHNRFVFMVGDFVFRVTEPALRPIRRVLPDMGSFDLSPVALIFLLIFAQDMLSQVIAKFGL